MTDLKPEDRALIELTRPIIGIENRTAQEAFDIMADRIRSAWRTEGRESRPSGIRPGDIDWLERCKDAGHCGDGSLESKARHDHNERIDRLLSALSPSVEDPAWRPDRETVARLIHFMHGDGLSAEDAMRPSNDAHWNFWKDDPPHADAWKAADTILSLVPSQGTVEPVGEAGSMPGSSGFTMAAFKASDVPIGTKLYAAPVSQGKAQEGWVLVPRNPTREMIRAMDARSRRDPWPDGRGSDLYILADHERYAAMLAAAPAQPDAEGGEHGR